MLEDLALPTVAEIFAAAIVFIKDRSCSLRVIYCLFKPSLPQSPTSFS